jgi:hypothetical protein
MPLYVVSGFSRTRIIGRAVAHVRLKPDTTYVLQKLKVKFSRAKRGV